MPSGNHKVTYTCGHGEGVILIQGTPEQRRYKLASRTDWLCPACYQAERDQAYKNKIAARRATFDANPVLRVVISSRKDALYVLASGLWRENKDRLTDLGYQFGRLSDVFTQEPGLASRMDRIIAMRSAPQSLYRALKAKDSPDVDPAAWLEERYAEVAAFGYLPERGFHDAEMIGFLDLQARFAARRKTVMEQYPRPERLQWYDDLIRAVREETGKKSVQFNGTVYGGRNSRHVYLDNIKRALTDAQGTELEVWMQADAKWREDFEREMSSAEAA